MLKELVAVTAFIISLSVIVESVVVVQRNASVQVERAEKIIEAANEIE